MSEHTFEDDIDVFSIYYSSGMLAKINTAG